MHPNPAFRQTPMAEMIAFARARSFGVLVLVAPDDPQTGNLPLISHIPFALDADARSAELHLARSNPLARAGGGSATLVVSGPDAYVSPDWYGAQDQVPTWNYVAVHLRGRLEHLPDPALEGHLDRVSAQFEARLAPKAPWTSAKMSDGVMARMMRGILPFRLMIEHVQGTWKLNQNKTPDQRAGAAAGIAAGTPGLDPGAIAALMRGQDR